MNRTRRRQAGFSLLEMMVGLTLLALILVAVTQSVRTGLRMWQAAESNDAMAEWQQTERLLEHWLSRALPPNAYDTDSNVIFEHTPAGLRFLVDGEVGRKPAGYSRISLQAADNPACRDRQDLVLTWEDVAFAANFAPSASDRRVIMECADAISFEYDRGVALPPEMEMQASIALSKELPRIVRIRVTRDGVTKVLAARLLYAR
ncbi:type II secretion system protein J [Hyphomonas sp.]|uniref:PulJ/GspJ family protein n=1 Tax=Hyphomonas sp. TaxID=87 RepID=UPI00391A36A4